jgi:hypothetical protein
MLIRGARQNLQSCVTTNLKRSCISQALVEADISKSEKKEIIGQLQKDKY